MRRLADRASHFLNKGVEALLIILMAALVLDVWIGVADRYFFHWQLPWPGVLARYLMIWMALLAISCAIVRREHIGLTLLIHKLPVGLRRCVLIFSDLIVLGLFLYLCWYGIAFASSGLSRNSMIFGLSLAPAFTAVPVAAGLAAVQTLLVLVRDMGNQRIVHEAGEV